MKRARTSLLDRGRSERDASLHVVATEDDVAPAAYFDELGRCGLLSKRVVVRVLASTTRSAPSAVVDRLRRFVANLDELREFDHKWILIDVDHHFSGTHQLGTATALTEAAQLGAQVLVSNPNFEVWHLFHVADRPGPLRNARGVEEAFRAAGLRKNDFGTPPLTAERVRRAIQRARDAPASGLMPEDPGSAVWRLVAAVTT